MTRGAKVLAALVASLCSIALFGAPAAVAGDTPCTGGFDNPLTGKHDNVLVPPGASCFIQSADVKGNVKALEGSRLVVLGSTIGGSVVGDKAEVVDVGSNTIHGNVQITGGEFIDDGGDVDLDSNRLRGGNVVIEKVVGDIRVENNIVAGDLQVSENLIPGGSDSVLLRVFSNSFAGNVQVLKNEGDANKQVAENGVGGNLQCFDNDLPFSVGFNGVSGNAEGQCAEADPNVFRIIGTITSGPYSGTEYDATSASDTPPIDADTSISDTPTYVGDACRTLPAGDGGVALVERGGLDELGGPCTFQMKLDNIVAAGYSAGIVFNNVRPDCLEQVSMPAAGDIPFVLVNRVAGLQLLQVPGVTEQNACTTPTPAAGAEVASTTIEAIFDG